MKMFVCVICLTIFIGACNKKNDNVNQLLKDSKKGLFGSVEIYDEFGNKISDYTSISILGHCIDTIGYDTVIIEGKKKAQIFDSLFNVQIDETGKFNISSCHSGYYSFEFKKETFGINKIQNIQHSIGDADTLPTILMSKCPPASIDLKSLVLSADKKVLYIDREVSLTGSTSMKYSVVSRYFFSTSPDVSDQKYLYQWVSGATEGSGGYKNNVIVKKALDAVLSSGVKTTDTVIYVRAYIDNRKFYGYYDSPASKYMVFPNVTSPSEVRSFRIDSLMFK